MSGLDINSTAKEVAAQEDEGAFVHIHGLDDMPLFYTDDNGEERPVGVVVAGAHSSRYRQMEAQLRKRKIKSRQLTGMAIYDDNLEKAATCTLAWQGFLADGAEVRLTKVAAKDVYHKFPWVYEQVLEAMHDHKLFIEGGSRTLPTSSDSTAD